MLKRVYSAVLMLAMGLGAAAAWASLPDFTELIETNSPAVENQRLSACLVGRWGRLPAIRKCRSFFAAFLSNTKFPSARRSPWVRASSSAKTVTS